MNNSRGGDFTPGCFRMPYEVVMGDMMRGMLYKAE